MVHCKTSKPKARPVTVVVGELNDVILAPPNNTDHIPVPTVGVLAAIVAVVEAQTLCDGPAAAILGKSSREMFTVAVVAGHTPLEIVH